MTTSRRGIIAAGCWTLDRIKLIDSWPGEEGLSRINETDRQGGGSGHNLGVDIRRLDSDMPVFGIGLLGEDADGDFLLSRAESAGIDTQQLARTSQAETSYTDVMSVIETGKRTFFHHAGANDLLTPDHFNFHDSSAKMLHLGLLGVHKRLDERWQDDTNGWVSILKNAKSAGLKTNVELVSIDPRRIRELCTPCLPYLDYLIVNDYEMGALADIQTIKDGDTDEAQCIAAAQEVLQRGAMSLVCVHYPGGAACVTEQGTQTVPAFAVDPAHIRGTAGAGDAFAAGLLYGIHEEWSVRNAMLLAHAVAASSLRSATTVGSVESVDASLAFVN
nr:carbohydrate kinase family protein [Granulosicoccus sp.]